ncbi:MAG: methionine adenosyltransferase domain-containing protein, partial [Vampirovibrionia bacterium]
IAYAIGMSKTVSVLVVTFGTAKIPQENIEELVNKHFDLRPAAIIQKFDLRNLPKKNGGCFYNSLAAYGHMGRTDIDVPWEQVDKADALKEDAKKYGLAAV